MRKLCLWSGILMVALVLTVLSGCFLTEGGPEDTSKPVIEVHQPEAGAYLEAGTFILFETTFKDDLALGSYSIDVHDNLEGHGHGRIAQSSLDPSLIKWSFKRNYSILNDLIIFVARHDDDIEIDANAIAGPYDFIIQAVDFAGNATSFQDASTIEFEVFITNTSQAVVNITNLSEGELNIQVNIPFIVEGDITDPTTGAYAGMHSLEIILAEDQDDHQHIHARVSQDDHKELIHAYYEDQELNEFMLQGLISLDRLFSQQQLDELVQEAADHLLLTMKVLDEQGNLTINVTIVHVHVN
jgi:hypothetical protein